MKKLFLAMVAVGLSVASLSAFADTLELRNGSVIKGTFIGGSEAQISFRVGSSLQRYPVNDVVAIRFDSDSSNSNYDNSSSNNSGQQNYPPPQSNYPPAQSNNYPPPPQSNNYPSPNYSATQPNYPQQTPYSNSAPAPPPPDNNPVDMGDRVTVPTGTRINIRMIDAVDSSRNHVGDRFSASLDQPLYVNDTLIVPRGANVYGRLEEAKESGQLSGRAQLRLSLTGIVINGQNYPITTGDYAVASKSRSTGTAAKVGGGAVVGALIGAAVGGGKGAAIGAGVGAGAGTAAQIATKGEHVHVPSETLLEFVIDQPTTLPVSQNNQ